jgi:hypothetical protein
VAGCATASGQACVAALNRRRDYAYDAFCQNDQWPVLALVVATVLMQGAGTSATSPQVLSTSSDRQAPDAKERNDIYAAALAERFKNQSPDAQERNERTSGR